MKQLKIWLIPITAVLAAIAFFVRSMLSSKQSPSFPTEEKKKLEKEVELTKEEISKTEEKQYSDKEIEDKFNAK